MWQALGTSLGSNMIFNANAAGLLLSPGATGVFCAYFADGGTMNKFCHPPAPAGCVPGCVAGNAPSEWCRAEDAMDPSAPIYNCAWRPEDFGVMLRHHQQWPYTYNEVRVSTRAASVRRLYSED